MSLRWSSPRTSASRSDAQGQFHWNKEAISDEQLVERLQVEAAKEVQPDLHIHGDKAVRYERVAKAMAAAQSTGIRKIGFVTEPEQ